MVVTVVQVSGGVSSAAALAVVARMSNGHGVLGHFIDYGQPGVEQARKAARYVCAVLGVDLVESRCDLWGAPVGPVIGMLSANLAASRGAMTVAVGNRTGRRENDTEPRDGTAAFYGAMAVAVMEGSEPGRAVWFWQPVRGWSRETAAERLADVGVDVSALW